MKKFIYIAVAVILATSLVPGINYSAPAGFMEIILESPGASPEQTIDAEAVLSKRLKAFGVTAFETEVRPEQRQISIRFQDPLPAETILPLLSSTGKLEFCEVFTQPEILRILNAPGQEEAWKQWFALDTEAAEMQPVLGSITPEEIPGFSEFVISQLAAKALPDNLRFALGHASGTEGRREAYALRYSEGMEPLLTGAAVESSEAHYDEQAGMASIGIRFNEEGSAQWAKATRDNIHRPIAIVFDGLVYFAPRVMAEMTSGQAQITGDFSKEETRLIAALIQGGELPAPFQVKTVKQ
ncbi:MAG: hypothetical protein KDD19_23860 [Phaeodactylibacter sp.]|nr:hypothetical protein [Phaeodactylibacter sp.]